MATVVCDIWGKVLDIRSIHSTTPSVLHIGADLVLRASYGESEVHDTDNFHINARTDIFSVRERSI